MLILNFTRLIVTEEKASLIFGSLQVIFFTYLPNIPKWICGAKGMHFPSMQLPVCLFVCLFLYLYFYLYITDLKTGQLSDEIALHGDYTTNGQDNLNINFNIVRNQFCARGHLTPNADFSDGNERARTYVTTNIAPQWQLFNGGNWQILETIIRGYATSSKNHLFVITGTSK